MRGRRKKWAVPYLEEHPETVLTELDASLPFFASDKLYLEVGIGKGDFIIGLSAKQPGHYLGIEREENVLAMAARKVVEGSHEDIRLLSGDFDEYLEDLGALRFDAIYLNFSDPWPKKKHWKRRLTVANRLKAMAELLKPGAKIIVKTDNVGLYEFTLEQIPLAGLVCEYETADYQFDEERDAMSEYERRFRDLGQPIHRIIIRKEGE
ncbi:MAG: tRNA (guanosine(46)-N7)-methyltransferase TrmB [Bacilli bacterium]|nr:tRNA (guanosine(46)-N7)-methyltransferase TrmB [Bacilli bacterium]